MKNHSEQAGNSIFFQQLDSCCQKIAEQVGVKPIAEWTNGDYIKLSGLLSRKTKIHLSESTLKRIFGKSKTSSRYYPQKATRDALAQFIGYRDWYEFEFRNQVSATPPMPVKELPLEEPPVIRNSKPHNTWVVLAAFLAIAFILLIIVLKPKGTNEPVIKDIKLLCVNPEGLTPHSAIFKLAVKGSLPDSMDRFSINFIDGRPHTRFTDSVVSHYFEVPGRYYPLLLYKDKVIDTGYVYLQTKGWSITGYNQNDTTRVYPVNVPGIGKENTIGISAKEAFSAGVDTLHTFFIAFTNIKPSTISGDNFELSLHIKASVGRPGVRCSQADISIFGENDVHAIGIIKPECVTWTSYKFSENYKNGHKYDLRPLGHDLSNGGDLKLLVKDKHVQLMVNSQLVFETDYKTSIGKVMGVKITFSGLGNFKDFSLSDLNTKEKF